MAQSRNHQIKCKLALLNYTMLSSRSQPTAGDRRETDRGGDGAARGGAGGQARGGGTGEAQGRDREGSVAAGGGSQAHHGETVAGGAGETETCRAGRSEGP